MDRANGVKTFFVFDFLDRAYGLGPCQAVTICVTWPWLALVAGPVPAAFSLNGLGR